MHLKHNDSKQQMFLQIIYYFLLQIIQQLISLLFFVTDYYQLNLIYSLIALKLCLDRNAFLYLPSIFECSQKISILLYRILKMHLLSFYNVRLLLTCISPVLFNIFKNFYQLYPKFELLFFHHLLNLLLLQQILYRLLVPNILEPSPLHNGLINEFFLLLNHLAIVFYINMFINYCFTFIYFLYFLFIYISNSKTNK